MNCVAQTLILRYCPGRGPTSTFSFPSGCRAGVKVLSSGSLLQIVYYGADRMASLVVCFVAAPFLPGQPCLCGLSGWMDLLRSRGLPGPDSPLTHFVPKTLPGV